MTGAVFRAYSRRRSNAPEISRRSTPCWLCSTHTQVASRFGVVLTQKFAAQALGGASVISRIFRRQHRGISTVRSWKWHMERTLYGRNMSVLLRSTERVFRAFQGCSETGPADCHFLPPLVEIKMNKRQLSRRHFTLCAAVGLSLPIVPAASVVAADAPPRTVKLRNTAIVPAVGQGSARLGQGRHPETAEQEALRTGISLGMSLIDTSGNYGNGRSEKLIGRAIAGQRDSVFLVSKVEADEVSGDRMTRACEASLSRLGTNFLDLYLLHWPVPNSLFSDVVAGFEQLRAAGKIKAWGVSNFNIDQMEALFRIPEGSRCATNQVPYSLNSRGIERAFFLGARITISRSWRILHSAARIAH